VKIISIEFSVRPIVTAKRPGFTERITSKSQVEVEPEACCFRFGGGETAVLLRESAPKSVSDPNFRNISLIAFSKRSAWDLNPRVCCSTDRLWE